MFRTNSNQNQQQNPNIATQQQFDHTLLNVYINMYYTT